jgi:nitroimidazol reductase NimA-like FMN-containing flavoprotein (pyridoxamine 5'-phosphate oxidase superfamily)
MTYDEPALGPDFDLFPGERAPEPATVEQIRALVEQELFAVLCTQGDGQPYGSVVAFACSPDLRFFVFATPRATRKYRLLVANDRVALVVDNRSRYGEDLMRVGAITVTGRAQPLEAGPDMAWAAELLTSRHPHFASFVAAPSTVLFRVEAVRYLYVTRFQEVRQWIPAANG